MKHHTKGKYLNAIEDIHKSKEFHGTTWSKKYSISYAVVLAMKDLDMIHQTRYGYYQWIGNKWPSMTDVEKIYDRIQKKNKRYADESTVANNKQLTIEPLKRVARIEPVRQPVQEVRQVEEQNRPYPIMDVVIAFFAGMIAAGFVSLIWK